MKEVLSNGINKIRKEMSVDSLVEAKNVLGDTIDILQRENQLVEFRQSIRDIRNSLEEIQQKKINIKAEHPKPSKNAGQKVLKTVLTSKPQPPPGIISKKKKVEPITAKPIKKGKKKGKDEKEKYHIEFWIKI